MGCLYAKLGVNPKYTITKKNKGNVPIPNDARILHIPIPCGRCQKCVEKASREWAMRLKEEIKHDNKGKFITLTFSDESLTMLEIEVKNRIAKAIEKGGNKNKLNKKLKGYDLENEKCKVAIEYFRERWRNQNRRSGSKEKIKYWFSTELGQTNTERIHMHGIVFTDDVERLKRNWTYGKLDVGQFCNEQTINYIVKYLSKVDPIHKYYKSIRLNSNGIGAGYVESRNAKNNKYNGEKTELTYRDNKGMKTALPSYLVRKLLTEDEREKNWIHKLDEMTMYVNGVKYDVGDEKGIKRYENAIKNARAKAKRIGYNDDKIDNNQKEYENKLRDIKNITRNQKVFKLNNNNKKAS